MSTIIGVVVVKQRKIEVILADDHQIMREGLAKLISAKKDLKLIAQCSDGLQTVKLARHFRPDVIIMDITMPCLNGMAATHLITSEMKQARVIALSMHSEIHYIKNMIEAGALGYLQKNSAFKELLDAVQTVFEGKYYFGSQILTSICKNYLSLLNHGEKVKKKTGLNDDKMAILQKLSEGMTPKNVARKLGLEPGEVQKNIQEITRQWKKTL